MEGFKFSPLHFRASCLCDHSYGNDGVSGVKERRINTFRYAWCNVADFRGERGTGDEGGSGEDGEMRERL